MNMSQNQDANLIREKLNRDKTILTVGIICVFSIIIICAVLLPVLLNISYPNIANIYMSYLRYTPFVFLLLLIPLRRISRKATRMRAQLNSKERILNTPNNNQNSNQISNQISNRISYQNSKLSPRDKKIRSIAFFAFFAILMIILGVFLYDLHFLSVIIIVSFIGVITIGVFTVILVTNHSIRRSVNYNNRSNNYTISNQILTQNEDFTPQKLESNFATDQNLYKNNEISTQDKHSNNQKYCHVCGNKLEPGATYCKSCWADVPKEN